MAALAHFFAGRAHEQQYSTEPQPDSLDRESASNRGSCIPKPDLDIGLFRFLGVTRIPSGNAPSTHFADLTRHDSRQYL
jgi:hypothetical protein